MPDTSGDDEDMIKAPSVGRPQKYPWDKWIDEGGVIITRDVDFDVDVEVMRNLAMRLARRRRIAVTVQARGETLYITFTPSNTGSSTL
jgi:hypothetical protein